MVIWLLLLEWSSWLKVTNNSLWSPTKYHCNWNLHSHDWIFCGGAPQRCGTNAEWPYWTNTQPIRAYSGSIEGNTSSYKCIYSDIALRRNSEKYSLRKRPELDEARTVRYSGRSYRTLRIQNIPGIDCGSRLRMVEDSRKKTVEFEEFSGKRQPTSKEEESMKKATTSLLLCRAVW